MIKATEEINLKNNDNEIHKKSIDYEIHKKNIDYEIHRKHSKTIDESNPIHNLLI